MKLLPFMLGLLIGFSLTFTPSMGAEPEPIIQTVTQYKTLTATKYIRVNQNEPMKMEVTAYTSGYESTQKHKGEKGYGITYSGTVAGPGTCAVDQNYISLGTSLYVQGYGYCEATDTGSKIKGYAVDVWMANVSDAMKFGKQTRKVWILTDF